MFTSCDSKHFGVHCLCGRAHLSPRDKVNLNLILDDLSSYPNAFFFLVCVDIELCLDRCIQRADISIKKGHKKSACSKIRIFCEFKFNQLCIHTMCDSLYNTTESVALYRFTYENNIHPFRRNTKHEFRLCVQKKKINKSRQNDHRETLQFCINTRENDFLQLYYASRKTHILFFVYNTRRLIYFNIVAKCT